MGLVETKSKGNFLKIIQGKIRMTTDKDNEKAIKREWETKDGKKGVKYELVFDKITGVITDVYFKETEFGEVLCIDIKDDENYIISMPSNSRYAINFMRRLPGVDLSEKVELLSYDVEDEKTGKRNVGIKITQKDVIKDQFYDTEKKKTIGGMPEMKQDNPDSDDWKVHFIKVKKFLKENTIKIMQYHDLESPKKELDSVDDLPV